MYTTDRAKIMGEKPMPTIIDTTDAIVKVTKTTICDTDLHILKGDVPEVTDGYILGQDKKGCLQHGKEV